MKIHRNLNMNERTLSKTTIIIVSSSIKAKIRFSFSDNAWAFDYCLVGLGLKRLKEIKHNFKILGFKLASLLDKVKSCLA